MKKAANNNTSIRVFCRMRPLNQLELSTGGECCITHNETSIRLKVQGEDTPYDFTFDGVFGAESTQLEVFQKVAEPVIDGVIQGYNGTIFAYGQTSSGKTYTMEGPTVIDSEDKKGIIPRMMTHLFGLILNSSDNIEFNVKVSFLEIYNEKIQDLLDPRKTNLQIKEDKTRGIFVQDATEIYVNSAEQMQQVHKTGSENRTIAATRMNERSSRSHSIFILHIIQKDIKTEATKHKTGKLYFVDLAGSEKVAKTHVSGQQLEEAKNINKSLTSLGMVINALTEKKEKTHVPYRDSKLTRLLQESLGGNSQTTLIVACSMCSYNDKETLSTLRFGSRAKNIKNTPIVNVERSAKELMALLENAEKRIKEQDEIIQNLQQQLDNAPSTGIIPSLDIAKKEKNEVAETEDKTSQNERNPPFEKKKTATETSTSAGSASLTLLKQHIQIVNLSEEIQELKLANKELENEISNKNQEVYDLNEKLLQYETQIAELTEKNLAVMEEFQVKFEKICHENQEKAMLANKFKRLLTRLRSDLNFLYIKSPDGVDESPSNKEDIIISSIQNSISKLEELEKEFEQATSTSTQTEELEAIVDAMIKGPQSSRRRLGTVIKPESSEGSQPMPKLKQAPTELLSTAADEELKLTLPTEESSSERRDSVDAFESLKTEGDNDDDIIQRIQAQLLQLTDEEKIQELQTLVSDQRKTISNLAKMNAELSQANNKYQQKQDKKIQSYKNKIEELQKFYTEKVRDYDKKIQNMKALLEEKLQEINELRSKNDKELIAKNQIITDLRYQNEKMQKIIMSNDLAKRVSELEHKIKEFALERQKLFEDVFKLRKEVDEKEDIISDKNAQIQILQNNLNTISTELETLKYLRPKPQRSVSKRNSKDFDTSKVEEENKMNQRKKSDLLFFDKHVIKPIRGGGGNVKNFERDNYLIFEKPSSLDEPQATQRKQKVSKLETPQTSRDFNYPPEAALTTRDQAEKSFRKFDEILKQKNSQSSLDKSRMNLNIGTDFDEEEEVNYAEVQEKLRTISTKHSQTNDKAGKSFFDSVKNFFS